MNKIYLDTSEFELGSFNRYTQLNNDKINSYADISFLNVVDYELLESFVGREITSLRIKADDVTIYNAENISAKMTRLNETLRDGKIVYSATIVFNIVT